MECDPRPMDNEDRVRRWPEYLQRRRNRETMESFSKDPPDKQYEELMLGLFREASFTVECEPLINGKNPDLLVKADDGLCCIVECTTVHWEGRHEYTWDENGSGHLMVDDSDPMNRNTKLWNSIKGKLQKYKGDTFPGYGLVIAIYNWSLSNDDNDAVDVCFEQSDRYLTLSDGKVVGRGWRRPLDLEPDLAIFQAPDTKHCSAIIHSTHLFALNSVDGEYEHVNNADAHHLLIPNPKAPHPVPERFFPFCDVLDLPSLRNGDGSIPTRKPLTMRVKNRIA